MLFGPLSWDIQCPSKSPERATWWTNLDALCLQVSLLIPYNSSNAIALFAVELINRFLFCFRNCEHDSQTLFGDVTSYARSFGLGCITQAHLGQRT